MQGGEIISVVTFDVVVVIVVVVFRLSPTRVVYLSFYFSSNLLILTGERKKVSPSLSIVSSFFFPFLHPIVALKSLPLPIKTTLSAKN